MPHYTSISLQLSTPPLPVFCIIWMKWLFVLFSVERLTFIDTTIRLKNKSAITIVVIWFLYILHSQNILSDFIKIKELCTQNSNKKVFYDRSLIRKISARWTSDRKWPKFGQILPTSTHGVLVILEPVEGIAEGSNLPGNSSQVLEDLALRVHDLDALGVGVVACREVLRDGGSEFAEN